MKRYLFLIISVLLVNITFAQNRAFIVNEKFDSAFMPEGWYCVDEGMTHLSITTTNNAGGDPNELRLRSTVDWNPITSGIHLVMATADLTGIENVGISFKHYLEYFQQSSTIGIATSSDNGATWNTGWSQSYSSGGQYSINETISTSDMGKDNVLFCLFFEGNTYNINFWYFDDIAIFTQSGNEGADIQMSSIDVNSIVEYGDVEVSFSVNNISQEEITSFEASCQIDGNEVMTETFDTSISPSENKQFTFSNDINLEPGTYYLTIDIVSVNGENDSDESNNAMTKEIRVFLKTVQRTPMIEHFSSSTCQPCVGIDNAMMALTEENHGKYTYTKYPMNIPGLGDPYCIEECVARADYYGVTGVPRIALDGVLQQGAVSQAALDGRLETVSYVDIKGAFETNDSTISLTADIISYVDMPEVKVFLTINEKTTTGNVGSNGQTEFHHIIMKMLGGSTGIETSLKAGQYQRFEFSYDMNETNMEEINDLEIAVWVQDYDSKEVLNSHYLYEYTGHPYPAQNLNINGNTISWEAPEEGTPSGYDLYVNNELIAENTTELTHTFNDIDIVEVIALYEDKTSVGITNLEHIECDAPQNIEATALDSNISISWDNVEGATEYQLYRNSVLLTTTSSTEYTDNDIEQGVMYCYNVRTSCGDGSYSGFSEESCAQVGVSLYEYENIFEIYPNPAEDNIYIATSETIKEICIYNIMGIKVLSQSDLTDNHLDISHLKKGIYFININGETIKKIIRK